MNQQQFSTKVQGLERKLYRVSRTILSSDTDCQDALQEALIKAWMRRDSLRDEGLFEAWLIRILINECYRLAKRSRRHHHDELSEHIAAPHDAPDRSLFEALYTLDKKYRMPIALHYVEGYSVSEIAGILNAPPGTVKSWLHYGRERLKNQLVKEAEL